MVTPLVNPTTFVTRLEAVFWTPVTIDAAKSDPGKVGRVTLRPPPGVETGIDAGRGALVEGR